MANGSHVRSGVTNPAKFELGSGSYCWSEVVCTLSMTSQANRPLFMLLNIHVRTNTPLELHGEVATRDIQDVERYYYQNATKARKPAGTMVLLKLIKISGTDVVARTESFRP